MATIAQLDVVLGLKGQGAFRRNLLAATAAVTAAGVAFDQLITKGGKIAPVLTAFTTRVGNQTAALAKLRAATNGLVSDFDLMTQANTAFTLGSAQSIDQFAEMADIAQRLGRALGVDATYALESLNTGIARQSKLFLDNLGILIDVEQANEKYALALGKQAAQLTDLERREAFRIAAMEAANEAVSNLGDSTSNAADAWAALKVQVGNASDSMATAVANSNTLKQGLDAVTAALKGDFDEASAAFIRFLTNGTGQMSGFTGPPTDIPKTLDEVAVAATEATPAIDQLAKTGRFYTDGQFEMVQRTGEAVSMLDVYRLTLDATTASVSKLAQAQSLLSSGLGLLGGLGNLLGFSVPGISQLFGLSGILRSGGGLLDFFSGGGEARASGGPVEAGRAYLVGEQGPEVVVPSQSGTVIPNGGLSINVSMSPARNRSEALRDREWMLELQRGADRLRANGYSFA